MENRPTNTPRSSASHQSTASCHLNIENRDQLLQFLDKIRKRFLEVVEPLESGLLDDLYSVRTLTVRDLESFAGKDVNTRTDQARKLWFRLRDLPVHEFLSKVAPTFIQKYHHIIPEEFWTEEAVHARSECDAEHCLHCDIRSRFAPVLMADLLYDRLPHDLTLKEYKDIASRSLKAASRTPEANDAWRKMFDACRRQSENVGARLVEDLRAFLQRKIHVPQNLSELVSRGIPCTCSAAGADSVLPQVSKRSTSRMVNSWLGKCRPDADCAVQNQEQGAGADSVLPQASKRSSSMVNSWLAKCPPDVDQEQGADQDNTQDPSTQRAAKPSK